MVGDTLAEIWATFGNSPDMDSAHVWANHVYKLILQEVYRAFGRQDDRLLQYIDKVWKYLTELQGAEDEDEDSMNSIAHQASVNNRAEQDLSSWLAVHYGRHECRFFIEDLQ
jgi:hypothetical protein